MSDFIDRMKALEAPTKVILPRKTNTVIRLDGKAFHTFTRGLDRPFDVSLIGSMNATAIKLCQEIPGAVCAYIQSDEISIILTDYMGTNTEPWFGGSLQKIVSVSASIATQTFNDVFNQYEPRIKKAAYFDSRVFTVDDPEDLNDYLVYRQADAYRNAITMIADSHFGHAALVGKSTEDRLEMLRKIGADPGFDYPVTWLRGRFIAAAHETSDVEYTDPAGKVQVVSNVMRKVWRMESTPDFRDCPEVLLDLLPKRAVGSPA
jgi:tRNA(His) guanylyltransferase